jgi:sulfate adenylyltransferase
VTSPAAPIRGACLWFTGLSGSGKSTTARAVHAALEERGRVVTMLDGDVVRTHLSRGLGFSREDRDENVRRVAFVAAEVVRHGGIVVCALVSPYRAARAEARAMVGDESFIEVFVDTPLEVCAERDVKGLYAGAQRGEVPALTGVADPYEPPQAPELRLETVGVELADNARRVIAYLEENGFLNSPTPASVV